jgi:hypothetical protein
MEKSVEVQDDDVFKKFGLPGIESREVFIPGWCGGSGGGG